MRKRIMSAVIICSMLMAGCSEQDSSLQEQENTSEAMQTETQAAEEAAQEQAVFYRKTADAIEKYILTDGVLKQSIAAEEEIETQQLESLMENRFLVWQDSFSGDTLDEEIWTYEEGKIRNGELQTYVAGDNNLSVKDGVLVIEAKKEGEQWTSASIETKDTKHFCGGRIEAKIRFTNVTGQWGAFWTMGAWESWPTAGEIDICEQYGDSASEYYKLTATLHYLNQYNEPAESVIAEANSFNNQLKDGEYHIFALEWDEKEIKIFVDNDNFATFDTNQYQFGSLNEQLNTKCNPFLQPQYIKLNMAVNPDTTPDEGKTTKMEVDWVRVYADEEASLAQQIIPSKLGIDYIYKTADADRITMSDLEWEGKAGEKIYLGVIYFPKTAVDRTYRFRIDNEDVATITENGVLTVNQAGTITVTAEDRLSGITASRKLHISLISE